MVKGLSEALRVGLWVVKVSSNLDQHYDIHMKYGNGGHDQFGVSDQEPSKITLMFIRVIVQLYFLWSGFHQWMFGR